MSDDLTTLRADLVSLQNVFEATSGGWCEAELTHLPYVEIPADWRKSPNRGNRDAQSRRQDKLSEFRRDRFTTIPGGKPLPTVDWVRWWELSGPTDEVSRLISLSEDASLVMKSLDELVRFDDWVYQFTRPPFQYLSHPARWISTVFDIAWAEYPETALRAPRWAWLPVSPHANIELANGDDWGKSAAEQCSPIWGEKAELADRAGWWFSRIGDFARASSQAIDLIIWELDERTGEIHDE